jgi:hypothetical protein
MNFQQPSSKPAGKPVKNNRTLQAPALAVDKFSFSFRQPFISCPAESPFGLLPGG